jgi:uncharacterized membrane protein YkoI
MTKRRKSLIAGAAALALAAGGAGIAVATGGGDDDATETPIQSGASEKASAAALPHVGGGKVTATEVGDEESHYEVEVTRADGSQVDVQLDRDFNVVGGESGGQESGEDDAPGEQ